MYYDDYDDYDGRRRWKVLGIAAAIAVVAAIVLWQVRSGSTDDTGDDAAPADTTSEDTGSVETGSVEPGTATTAPARSAAPSSTADATATPATGSAAPSTSEEPGVSTGGTRSPSTTLADDPAPSSSTASGSIAPVADVGYPTNPDGTPLPIVVIFDTDTITITGQVPSQAAKDRLGGLAIANSQFPDAQLIDNMVINPAVPISVGVRVIELNSARFPEGSADILPPHALELDRVVTIMKALPNISVLVIGHADQRGDEATNFAISDERARAVLNYLLYLGISPTRLASRAAGESDLLTIAEDDTALALNRRTEFVFSGLLIE